MSNQTFYTDLDTLLDTRIGTVAKLGDGYVDEILGNDYNNRKHDDLSTLSTTLKSDEYIAAFKDRDVETLKFSYMSNMITFIKNVIDRVNVESIDNPTADLVHLDVNLYPYKLSVAEKDILLLALAARIGTHVSIKCIYIPTLHMTTASITARWKILWMYNFDEWMNVHHELLIKEPMPSVELYVPKILANKDSTPDVIDRKGHKVDVTAFKDYCPFDAASLTLFSYLSLTWVGIKHYSIMEL